MSKFGDLVRVEGSGYTVEMWRDHVFMVLVAEASPPMALLLQLTPDKVLGELDGWKGALFSNDKANAGEHIVQVTIRPDDLIPVKL